MNGRYEQNIKKRRDWTLDLTGSRVGRVLLHTLCLFKNPDRRRWHWHGILREFAGQT